MSDAKQSSGPYREYTAVVLAGGEGTRLEPLSCGRAKALLPVAGKPMLSYALEWLVKGGFSKPLIVTTQRDSAEIQDWVSRECPALGCAPAITSVSDDSDTAHALKAVAGKIERNALVVSCDTITDLNIANVLSFHRTKQATVTVVAKHAKPPKEGSKERHLIEYFGLEGEDNRITLFASSAELSDPAPLPRGYLSRRPNITLTRSLFDSHIYVLSKWAIDLIAEKKHITSVKHELLPLIAEEQFRRLKPDGTWGDLGVCPPPHDALPSSGDPFASMLCPQDLGCSSAVPALYDPIKVYAYIMDNDGQLAVDPIDLKKVHLKGDKTDYLMRVNHISTFADACRKFATQQSMSGSVVGENVTIGKGTKVSKCVLLDNVNIGENCMLKNCIIGGGSVIPTGCSLKDCVLGFGIDGLEQGEDYHNETISREDFQ
eukprot:Rhum_TRINITY_DN18929_c0_g1::Rhum_TRINITY_DN18929_c0_g1_i1::g.168714::m.168714/K03241/EIF2B3; translation initiation factor eIF-2B subunit gamma